MSESTKDRPILISSSSQDRIFGKISKFFLIVSSIIMIIMPIPVFIDVVIRTIFDYSALGLIEVEEFMLVLVIYFSLSYAHISGGHISIDFITNKFPEKTRAVLSGVMSLLAVVLFFLLTWQLIGTGIKKLNYGEHSKDLGILTGIFYVLTGLGAALMIYATAKDFIASLVNNYMKGRIIPLLIGICLAAIVFCMPFTGVLSEWGPAAMGITGLLLLFLMIFLGMPIGFAMGIAGFWGLVMVYDSSLPALRNLALGSYSQGANYFFTVGPLFILMGQLAYHSGISQDLFETASKWLGRLRGGVAISSVAGCAGFAAVCGDSLATAVTMGSIAIPEMEKRNYDMSLGTACLAAGGTLGILIPPSVGFIFYAMVTEVSIGQLFVAGFIPGIILSIFFIMTVWITAKIYPEKAPAGESCGWIEKIVSLKGVLGMLALFVLILGGILGGIFSPVEGGSIGCVGALLIATVRRRITGRIFINCVYETVLITSKLFMILIGVGIVGFFLAATQLPFMLADYVLALAVNPYIVISAILVLFILMGCVLNVIPMILLVLPTLFPTVTALGFDPVWFGVVCVISMEMGQITPPIGVNVFAIGSVAPDVPMGDIFKGIVPFFFCMVLMVIVLIIFPDTATWLPNLLY